MDKNNAAKLSYDSIRRMYKNYLESTETCKSPNTINTQAGDTFYLWNNISKDVFWDTVFSEQFEQIARTLLREALSDNSTGNIEKLIPGYVAHLKSFRKYILNLT